MPGVKLLILATVFLLFCFSPSLAGVSVEIEGLGAVPNTAILARGKRVALVIGNEAYRQLPHAPLNQNDARAMADFFRSLGFDKVVLGVDVDGSELHAKMVDAKDVGANAATDDGGRIDALEAGDYIDLLVVFFAGRSVNVAGKDILLAVDADGLGVESQARIALDGLIDGFANSARIKLFIFNTCHDQKDSPLPDNTVVFFAAQYGCPMNQAGRGKSLLVESLVENLSVPGRPIIHALGAVEIDVERRTGRQQRPRREGLFDGDPIMVPLSEDQIKRDFAKAKSLDTEEAYLAFLKEYSKEQHVKTRGVFVPEEIEEAEVRLDKKRRLRVELSRGTSYAFIIGNRNYRDGEFQSLATPHSDADAIANILTTRYGFTTVLTVPERRSDGKPRVMTSKRLFLLDRPKEELLSLLDDLEEVMNEHDRLLIYYAGHGHLDHNTGKAYWIPVEARRNRRQEWISSDNIISALKGIRARSVLVIADSCFAGALFRGDGRGSEPTDGELEGSLFRDAERPSRVLIASGGTEPVLDGGGSGHSIFARKLIDALQNPVRQIFSARELHVRQLKPRVSGNVSQVPQYDWLRDSGHDSGDFVFMQLQALQASAPK